MTIMNTELRYGSIMKVLHWTLFLLITSMLVVGFLMGKISNEGLKYQIYDIHKVIGLTVLILGILLILWRIVNIKPRFPDTMPRWECSAARIVHTLLYILLITMPISGWVMATASGYPPHLGGWAMPIWGVTKNEAVVKLVANIHYILAWTLVCLASIHTFAALKHHFFDKNNILKRMLPGDKS